MQPDQTTSKASKPPKDGTGVAPVKTGRPRAIPPRLESEVISRYADGWSCRRIAEWLQAEHGCDASYGAVARLLKTHREEMASQTRQVAREQLAPSIKSDISEFDKLLERLRNVEDDCAKTPDMMSHRLKAMELQFRIYDRKLHYAGVGEPDAPSAVVGVVMLPPEETDGD